MYRLNIFTVIQFVIPSIMFYYIKYILNSYYYFIFILTHVSSVWTEMDTLVLVAQRAAVCRLSLLKNCTKIIKKKICPTFFFLYLTYLALNVCPSRHNIIFFVSMSSIGNIEVIILSVWFAINLNLLYYNVSK